MAGMSTYLQNQLIDCILRGQTLTIGAKSCTWAAGAPTLYVGLFTANPTDTGGGTEVSTSGTNYARFGLGTGTPSAAVAAALTGSMSGTLNSTQTIASSGTSSPGVSYNLNQVTAPTPSGSNWGTITGFGIFDASTSGNLLYWGTFGASTKTVNSTDPAPYFAAGSLSVSQD